MTYVNPSEEQGPEGGVVIRQPRITDALGKALRHAFEPYQRLPAEWQRRLDALDRLR